MFKRPIFGNFFSPFNICRKTFFISNCNSQTIYALSSGISTAIVRISGPNAFKIVDLLSPKHQPFLTSKEQSLSKYNIKPREMSLRKVYGLQSGLIDQCLLVYFQDQHSYTGEDIFEFHLHGSRAIVSALFKELSRLQFRMATRGQFTRRSVLNNRMSLQQAEAINDLVQSEFQFERQVAINNLLGKNEQFLQSLRKQLIDAKGQIEAFIEFQEEQVGSGILTKALTKIFILSKTMRQVVSSSKQLQQAKDGIKISIVGRPNVGKSTLINQMVKKNVSIISSIPGTTRDLIQSQIQLEGFRVKFVDTAGIRQSQCEIERQGIHRTKKSVAQSQFVIVLFDISRASFVETDKTIIINPHQVQIELLKKQNKILVVNKCDALSQIQLTKSVFIQIEEQKPIKVDCCVSLNSFSGVQTIKSSLIPRLNTKFNLCSKQSSDTYFTRARYIQGLQRCCSLLQNCKQTDYPDIISQNVTTALRQIQELVGKIDNEEVLDSIFSNFCIGK